MRDVLRITAISAVCLFAICLNGQARADCALPPRAPQMPQGATASEEDMREGKDKLQAYVNILQTYQTCMHKQIDDAPPDTKPEVKAQWAANADAAIDAAHEIADVYSIQLKVWKARQ